jgi:hypothetical protein
MLLFNDAQQRPLWAWKDSHIMIMISDITGTKALHRSRVVMDAPMPRGPGPLTTALSEAGERAPDPTFVQACHKYPGHVHFLTSGLGGPDRLRISAM